MKEKGKYIDSLDLLKVLGIILIFNSHCDDLYPNSSLATGGAIGNSVFFILSGFFINIGREKTLVRLSLDRIKQLYPGVVIVTTILFAVKHYLPNTVIEWFKAFIYPTSYWFLWALVIFGGMIWCLQKKSIITDHFKYFSIAVLIIYFVLYIFVDKTRWSVEEVGLTTFHGWFKMIHYFYIFALGFKLKNMKDGTLNIIKRRVVLQILAISSFLAQMALKLIMVRFPILYSIQFVSQLFDILFAWFMMLWALDVNEKYIEIIPKRIRRITSSFSKYSWEMYLVQFVFINFFTGFSFPINLIISFSLSVVSAVVLSALTRYLRNLSYNKLVR